MTAVADRRPEVPGGANRSTGAGRGLRRWLLANRVQPVGPEAGEEHAEPQAWWKVMCLTGVDYFSSLSYLPGIAALAAGALSPVATLLIVALTLLGMLPMYRRIAVESPHGQGSVAMLENLLPFWRGKLVVLALLGFVATSWIITITLSAADATAHFEENPYAPDVLASHPVLLTVGLLLLLGGVFLAGFSEAVTIAIPLVAVFLLLNAAVVVVSFAEIAADPSVISGWTDALTATGGFGSLLSTTLLAFPLLVLGLSGFETGVSMMPLMASDGRTDEERLAARIANTRKLLTLAAVIMSVYLLTTTFVTTVLIPPEEFESGGQANGRALAYLAHEYLGNGFGTVYDVSSILILWFAGASAMAGLLNLVPRYLPRYGMAPQWARAIRPLVFVFTAIAFAVTIWFGADVNAQGGAYATGVLVLISSASVAVTLSARRARRRRAVAFFAAVSAVFVYTTVANVLERPDGLRIGGLFILAIIVVSLVSRGRRVFELRGAGISFDETAQQYLACLARCGTLRFVAHDPSDRSADDYRDKVVQVRRDNDLPKWAPLVFIEVVVVDASDFETTLHVEGEERFGHRILTVKGSVVANTIAEILLAIRDRTGFVPH